MDISVFKTFTIVAKYGSISIAGEEVHLTQPAVTKQVKYLEELYGMKLFERGSKLKLTEAGKMVLVYAHQLLNTYNESLQAISENGERVQGTLKFGSNLTLGIYVLPKLMGHFLDLYPEVKPDVFLHNTENIVRAIKQKAVNFGFISADIKEPQIQRHVFYEDRITIVAGKPLGLNAKTVGWNELQRLPFIMRERGSDIRETVEQWLKDRTIRLQPRMELNNTEAIKECVRCGIGFSCLPRCSVEEDLRLGCLQEIHAPYFEPVQKFYICHYEGKRFSKPEKIFLEYLFEAIESRSGSPPRASILPPELRKPSLA
jgi:LysR family transcriptional regulator, transcriptional activator of the cysJI operon